MDAFSKICSDIKSIKIQGATNVARAALKAYSLRPTKKSKSVLMKLRPTEPMLWNAIHVAEKSSFKKALDHFENAQAFINHYVHKLISPNSIIFTHCHSNTLAQALVAAHKNGKKFSVLNTETRPLLQGRITAKQLSRAGIKVAMSVDSAMMEDIKKADIVILGADAVTKKGVINKIGSASIARLAKDYKKPLYIVTDSWKFSTQKVPIERRSAKEVWDGAPKKVRIENDSFELIPGKQVAGIISEFGILPYKRFLKEANQGLKNY